MSSLQVDQWRQVATQFRAIREELAVGNLPPSFEPAHLEAIWRSPRTPAITAVFSFLLHIWNDAFPFDLGQVRRWDRHHRGAFRAWVEGRITGESCRYF